MHVPAPVTPGAQNPSLAWRCELCWPHVFLRHYVGCLNLLLSRWGGHAWTQQTVTMARSSGREFVANEANEWFLQIHKAGRQTDQMVQWFQEDIAVFGGWTCLHGFGSQLHYPITSLFQTEIFCDKCLGNNWLRCIRFIAPHTCKRWLRCAIRYFSCAQAHKRTDDGYLSQA